MALILAETERRLFERRVRHHDGVRQHCRHLMLDSNCPKLQMPAQDHWTIKVLLAELHDLPRRLDVCQLEHGSIVAEEVQGRN